MRKMTRTVKKVQGCGSSCSSTFKLGKGCQNTNLWIRTLLRNYRVSNIKGSIVGPGRHIFDCPHAKPPEKVEHSIQKYLDYIMNKLTMVGSEVKYTIKQ